MDILADLQELYNKWKSKSDEVGSKDYELTQWHDALYYCINSLGDVIIKHEKARQKDSADCPCYFNGDFCEHCGITDDLCHHPLKHR